MQHSVYCLLYFTQQQHKVLKLDPKIQNKGFMRCSLIHTEKALDDQSEGIFVGFMCTYPREETWVHQLDSLHQLHYPHSDSRHDITFISLCICKIIGGSMKKTHTSGENRNCLYIYSALFVCNAIFPQVYYLDIGIRKKSSIIVTIH